MSEIVPHGEPFLHPGNEIGCLLLHGFTSSPDELRELGDHLAGRGYTVLGVRLFGHATRERDMNRARYRDWIASAEDGFHMLRPNCEHMVLIGLSMGAVLSLILTARWTTSGVVAMGTPFKLPNDPRLPFARPLSFIWPRVPKPKSRRHEDEEWPPHVAYEHYPTHAIAELNELLAVMRASLAEVTAPVLLMHALEDSAVDPEHLHMIQSELRSAESRSMLIEDSGHLIPVDDQRQRAFRAIAEFVKEVTGHTN